MISACFAETTNWRLEETRHCGGMHRIPVHAMGPLFSSTARRQAWGGGFFHGKCVPVYERPGFGTGQAVQVLGAYAADTWKVNPKLTLNYGLRWEPYFPMVNRKGTAIHFDPMRCERASRAPGSKHPPGVFFVGDPGFRSNRPVQPVVEFFATCRIGMGCGGDGRTSVRASAGTFYDYLPRNMQNLGTAPPWFLRIIQNNVNFADPWKNYPGGDPFPMPMDECWSGCAMAAVQYCHRHGL